MAGGRRVARLPLSSRCLVASPEGSRLARYRGNHLPVRADPIETSLLFPRDELAIDLSDQGE